MSTPTPPTVTAVTICRRRWQDSDAARLRAAMTSELRDRYADRPTDPVHLPPAEAVDAAPVAWTGVATARIPVFPPYDVLPWSLCLARTLAPPPVDPHQPGRTAPA
ncbi:hypothetical protein CA850_23595 [Micromonospora echinospora]|uniref:Uncharacterized protein n=1 Tax=Micromonospora echinospora TaxID=1877 RepID=A0A1C4YUA6_MICEC|nr:hypothetical protein [Micromonospora echinospora]OZV77422.1 hypothetical protein CA850_23595 [Micromonospora echinospora]SCF24250.1 hypothetical protein GA0070618_4377 [Micromonospora echinospora]